MKRLYDKNTLGFALLWIGVYVVGLSVADGLSSTVGMEKIITAPLGIGMTAYLLIWLDRNGLLGTYGSYSLREFFEKAYATISASSRCH